MDGLRAIGELWPHVQLLELRHTDAERVTHPGTWADGWPGVAGGRGVPGYDTDSGVAKVRAEVQAAHEQAMERERPARPGKRRGTSEPPSAPPQAPAGEQALPLGRPGPPTEG